MCSTVKDVSIHCTHLHDQTCIDMTNLAKNVNFAVFLIINENVSTENVDMQYFVKTRHASST